MPELNLPICPICLAKDSLSRQTMERAGQRFVWYECRECGSVLLWMGDDRWVYQKIGRQGKEHLLKRPMTVANLRHMTQTAEAPAAARTPPPIIMQDKAKSRAEADLVTLTCPSCGGKLQITNDINRFACAYCGTEHVVRRSGGLVSLAPVVEEIRHVSAGVDRTASELAIRRLTEEIAELEAKKKDTPSGSLQAGLFLAGAICIVGFCLFSSMGASGEACLIPLVAAAIVFTISLITWNKEANRHIASVEQEITRKREELKKHKKAVTR